MKKVFRKWGRNYSGTYAMSLAGSLLLHTPVLHVGLTREKLTTALKRAFGRGRAVVVKEMDAGQSMQEAVNPLELCDSVD